MESSKALRVSNKGVMRSSKSKFPEYFTEVKIEAMLENRAYLPAGNKAGPKTTKMGDTASFSQFDQLRVDLSGLLDDIDQSPRTLTKRSKINWRFDLFGRPIAVDQVPTPGTHKFAIPSLNQVPSYGVGYFSLSREIRDMIMDLVLCPGHIFFSPATSPEQNSEHRPKSHYGIQLLATCQQTYEEGYKLYYTSNIFHLPPGPLTHTRNILQSIQPMHLKLIKKYVIDINFIDLWGCDLTEVSRDAVEQMKRIAHRARLPTANYGEARCYAAAVCSHLLKEWEYKLTYVEWQCSSYGADLWVEVNVPLPNEHWKRGLRHLSSRSFQRLQFPDPLAPRDTPISYIKHANNYRTERWYRKLSDYRLGNNYQEYSVTSLYANAHFIAAEYVNNKVRQEGWKSFVQWLEKSSLKVYEEHVLSIYQHAEHWYSDVSEKGSFTICGTFRD